MGNRELKKIIDKCLLSGEYRIAIEDAAAADGETFGSLSRLLVSLISSDLPFCYAKAGRDVLIVDHVVFDSRKKQSGQAEELADMFAGKRDLTLQKMLINGRYKMLPPVSKGPNTARNYIANCALSFAGHYSRLPAYKAALERMGVIRPDCRVKTCLLIEDITPLGSYIVSEDGMRELVLLYVKQFLDLFERSGALDYVLFGCFMGCSNALWFMGRSSIELFRKNEVDLIRKKYFSFNVQNHSPG